MKDKIHVKITLFLVTGKQQPSPEVEPLELPDDEDMGVDDEDDKGSEGEDEKENPFDIDFMKSKIFNCNIHFFRHNLLFQISFLKYHLKFL